MTLTEGGTAMIDGHELFEMLLSRRVIVDRLADEPLTKPELVAACGVSRSTIDRGISALEEEGLVARGEGGRYEVTLFGEVTVREFERSLAHMDMLASVRDLITELASDADVDATLFEEATIHHTSGLSIATVLKAFADATELRIVNPPFSLLFVGFSSDDGAFTDGEMTALVRSDVLAELAVFIPNLAETHRYASIDLYEIDDDLPISFALVKRRTGRSLCLVLGDERKGMAIAETDTEAAIERGSELYERVLEHARPVPAPN